MKATNETPVRLATLRIDSLGSGYRPTALMARLRQPRLNALQRLCRSAERKPAWLYDAQRAEPRSSLPCERLDAAIVEGIQHGYITPEVLADYFGELFALYRAMMPGGAEATYMDAVREGAEALEKVSVARAIPTPENCEGAARESLEASVAFTAHAKQLQRGSAA